jgi:hypothetical protein
MHEQIRQIYPYLQLSIKRPWQPAMSLTHQSSKGCITMEEKKNQKEWIELGHGDKGKKELAEVLSKNNVDPELAKELQTQIQETAKNQHNVIFVFTEGTYAITAIHAPKSSLDGREGPVLMPGANDKNIIAAFSDEFIRSKIKTVDLLEENAGLTGIGDVAWMNELEKLVEIVRLELAANPPDKWESLLDSNESE